MNDSTESRPMTLGEKLAGTNFNPSGDATVQSIKDECAKLLDTALSIKDGIGREPGAETMVKQSIATAAIVGLQTVQMQLVKLATWK